jgi:hypothetical protein
MARPVHPTAVLGLALALFLAPSAASAQIAVLPKIGTGGIGGDVAIGLTDRLAVRGGIGFIPVEFDDVEVDDIPFSLSTPDFFATAGVDFKVAGPLRLMGGLLFRSGDFEYEAENTGDFQIGDETFDQTGRIFGAWENNTTAPFVGIGLGGTTGGGFGVFLDAGVAFTGDPEVTIDVDGELANAPGIQAEIERERQDINDDIPSYAQYWPFLQVGFRIGLGN